MHQNADSRLVWQHEETRWSCVHVPAEPLAGREQQLLTKSIGSPICLSPHHSLLPSHGVRVIHRRSPSSLCRCVCLSFRPSNSVSQRCTWAQSSTTACSITSHQSNPHSPGDTCQDPGEVPWIPDQLMHHRGCRTGRMSVSGFRETCASTKWAMAYQCLHTVPMLRTYTASLNVLFALGVHLRQITIQNDFRQRVHQGRVMYN